ncbi:cupin domain-containing protein [Rhodococcus fascians]|nr:cupin domain-containing protein [Rhodococcus fascians]MBY4433099.1 cupin domain-containing protein [Rhodococcus fascians]
MLNRPIIETFEHIEWKEFPGAPGVEYVDLEGSIYSPGQFTTKVKLPAGTETPPHVHRMPFTDRSTVISGVLHVGIGTELDKTNGTALRIGGIAFIPPGVSHYAWTEEETVIHVHGEGPWVTRDVGVE